MDILLHIILSCAILSYLVQFCALFIVNYNSVKMFTIGDNSSYFGYSILLQKGRMNFSRPIVIVGAPNKLQGGKKIGAVYKCNMENSQLCQQYQIQTKGIGVYIPDKSGNFLGASLDGEDYAGGKFYTCAPTFKIIYDASNYFVNGRCFMVKNSQDTTKIADVFIPLRNLKQINFFLSRMSYYDAAFAETGFDMKYFQDENELLLGDPGKGIWSGGLTRFDLNVYNSSTLSWKPEFTRNHDNYFGYSVDYGLFTGDSKTIWYVAGSPRSNDLTGKVVFFKRSFRIEGVSVISELLGEQFGSYFGASLLVIHTGDLYDEILIGAPMFSESSYDEGGVYYYKNSKEGGNFEKPIKLLGEQPGSRFGQVMADLGDIDLDLYNDVAIAAPYEDDGTGAVYIFYGSVDGFSRSNCHRITPSNFIKFLPEPVIIKGFGLGLAKGRDMDNDGHNDLAIGSYKSGHVFYFNTLSVIDISATVSTSLKTLFTSTQKFTVQYCAMYTQRNNAKTVETFEIVLLIDSNRVMNERNISSMISIESEKMSCRNHTVLLKKDILNTDPLTVSIQVKLSSSSSTSIPTQESLTIPVAFDCGSDNICEPDLIVNAILEERDSIIYGYDRNLRLNIAVDNFGETAYLTELYLTLPPDVTVINLRECLVHSNYYTCLITEELKLHATKTIRLDIQNFKPENDSLKIYITAKSFGNDSNYENNHMVLNVPVFFESSPYIYSDSSPTVFFWDKTNNSVQISHNYRIGNQGPSPLNLNLTILVPNSHEGGAFQINSIEGIFDDRVIECSIEKSQNIWNYFNNLRNFICNENDNGNNCSQIICRGGLFYKSSETASFTLKILAHMDILAKSLDEDIESVAFTTIVLLKNETNTTKSECSTLIYGLSQKSTIPFWIYVASTISGLILLLLLVFILYKCNFFNRTYKHKLENEQGLIEVSEHESTAEEASTELEDDQEEN